MNVILDLLVVAIILYVLLDMVDTDWPGDWPSGG